MKKPGWPFIRLAVRPSPRRPDHSSFSGFFSGCKVAILGCYKWRRCCQVLIEYKKVITFTEKTGWRSWSRAKRPIYSEHAEYCCFQIQWCLLVLLVLSCNYTGKTLKKNLNLVPMLNSFFLLHLIVQNVLFVRGLVSLLFRHILWSVPLRRLTVFLITHLQNLVLTYAFFSCWAKHQLVTLLWLTVSPSCPSSGSRYRPDQWLCHIQTLPAARAARGAHPLLWLRPM